MSENMRERYIKLRRALIERRFAKMNDMQRKAVVTTEGPLLILAGAGSGKTTVLINRIANILMFGCGYESENMPSHITEDDIEESDKDEDETREMLLTDTPAEPAADEYRFPPISLLHKEESPVIFRNRVFLLFQNRRRCFPISREQECHSRRTA